ncbi:MAG TPA: hypothetical protein VEY50_08370 [Lysobacter sp.]|nr:hypothetical protein [Lysobacter sp.]
MPLTLGLTGMDSATETALQAAFAAANARLGGRWQLVAGDEADYVVVDMDSMYGPMSWLKLHAAGKTVIGLTSAARSQTDVHLPKPVEVDALVDVLRGLDTGTPAAAAPATAAPAREPAAPPAESPAPAPTPAAEPPVAPPAPAPAPPPVRLDGPRSLADWLEDGLTGRVRVQRNGVAVLIDFEQRQYHAGSALKPLAPLFEGTFERGDFEPVSDEQWASESTRGGEAQPLMRLVWLGGLVRGHGALPAEYGPEQKFRLNKWPQTEREYPKHFRIATAMMKGPATLAEIIEASGVTASEVADFINANLATGYAEPVDEPEPGPEPAKTGSGLLGRLRGR